MVLSVDDGSYESAVGLPSGADSVSFVNRLTPPAYPATLKKVSIFFGNAAGNLSVGHPVTVLVATNPSGSTAINGLAFQRFNGTIAARGAFNELTLATPITLNSGDVVVGFSTANPPDLYPMALDESPTRQRSYFSTDGVSFRLIDAAGLPGNFAIRATVDVPQ